MKGTNNIMSNRTVNLNQIQTPTYFFVKGKLSYSRLTKKIEGEELQKDQQRRLSRGFNPIDKPYTTATIHDAAILQTNPAQKTNAEIYGEESFYHSKTNSGYSFTANNKGNNLPWIGTSMDNGKTVDQIIPESELANDLDVILVMRVFSTKLNNGVSLDGVIVLGPVKYFTNTTSSLADYGITFNPAPQSDTNVETVGPAPVQVPVQQPIQSETPFGQPQQTPTQQTPFGNPSPNPFSNNSPFGQQPSQPANFQNGYPNNGIQYNPN